MGDASMMENPVNYESFLPGRGAAGDGAAADELGDLAHLYPPIALN